MILLLPETCRRLVGNGIGRTSYVATPLIPFLRPRSNELQDFKTAKSSDIPSLPNPLIVLTLLKDRGTIAVVTCYGIYYMVHSCLQASLSTIFVQTYQLSGVAAGLIYIPFGIACSIASIVAGRPFSDSKPDQWTSFTELNLFHRPKLGSRLQGRCKRPGSHH